MSSVAATLNISGRVQGVGFRYYCIRQAGSFDITGWVKNNVDGSVTAYAEGEQDAVESFIDAVRQGPGSARIDDVDVDWTEPEGRYRSFEVAW